MKNRTNFSARSFFLGVLSTLLVVSLATPVLAAAGKMIEIYGGVKIYIDDVELHPTDAAGNPVEAFIYDGATYLPVRAVSEALDKVVQWDGKTQSVYIGKHSSDRPAAYLSQLDHFTSSGRWDVGYITKDNLGNDHSYSVDIDWTAAAFLTYKLNGQYSRLTALYYKKYEYRSHKPNETYTLVISGDGRELWHGEVGAGIDPINIDIDITGVLELTIEYPESATSNRCYSTALGDVALWS